MSHHSQASRPSWKARVLSQLVSVAVIGAVTLGVSQGTSAAAGGFHGISTIAFAMDTSSAQVFVEQDKEFVAEGRKLGIKVVTYNNEGTASEMLSNASLMVAAHPDFIVEYPSASQVTTRVGELFKRSGIPCIAVNIPVPGCPFFNFDQVYLAGLAANFFAHQMAKRGWNGHNTEVIIGECSTCGPSVNIAVTTFYADLTRKVPGMTHVTASRINPSTTTIVQGQGLQLDMGLTLDQGYTTTKDALQTIPKSKHLVIYTVSDDDTVGVYRALSLSKRAGNAMISGYGGDQDAIDALRKNPTWVADSMGFFNYWGEFILAMAVAIKEGAKPPKLTAPPMVVMDKANVNTFFRAGAFSLKLMPPLPPESKYLVKYGVLQKFGNVQGL